MYSTLETRNSWLKHAVEYYVNTLRTESAVTSAPVSERCTAPLNRIKYENDLNYVLNGTYPRVNQLLSHMIHNYFSSSCVVDKLTVHRTGRNICENEWVRARVNIITRIYVDTRKTSHSYVKNILSISLPKLPHNSITICSLHNFQVNSSKNLEKTKKYTCVLEKNKRKRQWNCRTIRPFL